VTVRMLSGPAVVRIEWLPGTDTLVGTCHCGAAHEAQDPVSMWEWLLGHPEGHEGGTAVAAAPPAVPALAPA
jgi:hypothetical protein